MTTILLTLGSLVGAIVVLIVSGKWVVRSVAVLARAFRISEYVISFVLLAFATSLPELSVGVNAALAGVPELSLGDIIGTNIINITLVMGAVAVVGGSVGLRDYEHFRQNRLFQLAAVLAPLILLLDGELSRWDGVVLLGLFVLVLIRLLDIDDRILGRKILRPHLAPHVGHSATTRLELWKYGVLLVVSATVLLGATYVIVTMAKAAAHSLAIPTVLIGVLVVATVTSLPELSIGVRSALRGRGGIALGDIFGAASINATFTLGTVALISPIVLDDLRVVWIGIGFSIFVFSCIFLFLHTKRSLSRAEGVVLLVWFLLFIAAQVWWV